MAGVARTILSNEVNMAEYIRNPLTLVWAFLTAITLASWTLSHGAGAEFQLNSVVSVGVLVIAAVKAQLVIHHFMEVRHAPAWLKRTVYGWNVALLFLLLGTYWLNS